MSGRPCLPKGCRRARYPEREAQILDLSMREIVGEPIATVQKIYRHFELELGQEALENMQRYLDLHPKDEFGIHRYSLEAFGLDQENVNALFKSYRERFDIEAEPF
ncbi:MAG: hypothetical protein VCB25_00490 [Myxococcota bacterium]